MDRTFLRNHIAPSDDSSVRNGNELRVAVRDVVHHELAGAGQRRSFEKCEVLSLTSNAIDGMMEALNVLGRYAFDRRLYPRSRVDRLCT